MDNCFTNIGVDRDWLMTVAVLASSRHNIKSFDPIDKVTIIRPKTSLARRITCAAAVGAPNSRPSTRCSSASQPWWRRTARNPLLF
ncbi:hypothetical protein C8R44DRAFT_164285 [Mycena epipterygia]|nr:hypothetical protein C8R44DRAFT_164285 [Mycena epipterygia]